ncbi:LytTR family DNA-binding domain-containing protein [Hyphobacterium marinum]|uniref:LytTR family DNA-binding domain-containing protein n=1 Tax=Hyphobacterium marinum TaxID=3116574 RepID=A0ABU7LV65_9PROT|nr:LytTR family DNA-binding domain-containing protein [Hyphobacterium sp. Y6023]MEE2565461.1 LytTR family DNA-binding domain-containing protein [Hyphobacterium sp. Y6023]
MTGTSSTALTADREADRRALLRAGLLCAAVIVVVYIVNSLSVGTEIVRSGDDQPGHYSWVLEGTAVTAMLILVPPVLWLGMAFPFERGRWRTALAVHLAAVLVYGALQVALMSGFRALVWPPIFDRPFGYGDTLWGTFVYEFRKQAAAYLGFQLILSTSRTMERLRLEARAARQDARAEQRITLKCGGRTIFAEAADFRVARAAGNYVEASFGTREHLARMTLAELETLLREAGIDAVRVHRSWLVNRAAITEITPTGEGDVTITLTGGDEVPGSRRYRAGLED